MEGCSCVCINVSAIYRFNSRVETIMYNSHNSLANFIGLRSQRYIIFIIGYSLSYFVGRFADILCFSSAECRRGRDGGYECHKTGAAVQLWRRWKWYFHARWSPEWWRKSQKTFKVVSHYTSVVLFQVPANA